MAIFVTSLVGLLLILIFYSYKFYVTSKVKNFPPGPSCIPVLGSYWALLKENYYFPHLSMVKLANRFNTDILGLYLGSSPAIVTLGYELCKEVLSRDEFAGRNDNIVTRGRSFGDLLGLFFVDGPYWQEQRRFSLRYMRDYGLGRRHDTTEENMEKEVRDLIELFASKPKTQDMDICHKQGELLFPDVFYASVLGPIMYMLIGRRCSNKKLRDIGRRTMRLSRSGNPTGCALSIVPWIRHIAPDFFGYTPIIEENAFLRDFFQEEINQHKNNFSDDYHADLTDTYISKIDEFKRMGEPSTTFVEKQLLWTLIDYAFPVPSATGQTLNWLWAYLLNYPEVQTKIQEEIDKVVGRCRLPNLDDRKNMPYTEACIKEILRVETLNPLGVPRRCIRDTYLKGYFIPKNTIVFPHLWSANRDSKIWNEPEIFRPERFLNDNGDLLKADYTLGFGGGKRVCVGETFSRHFIFLILTGLLQNYNFESVDKAPDLNKKIPGLAITIPEYWVKAISR